MKLLKASQPSLQFDHDQYQFKKQSFKVTFTLKAKAIHVPTF
jgi:hypothetical protein